MKQPTLLKVVHHDELGRPEAPTTSAGRETGHAPLSLERNLIDTLDSMERFMHNSLTKMLEGFAPLPGGRAAELLGGLSRVRPAVDVYEEGDDLVVTAELPGIDKKDISVRLRDGSLVISGEKKSERRDEATGYYRIERATGRFERTIQLPEGVKVDQATASFDNGILRIRIPKGSGAPLGRQIAIE